MGGERGPFEVAASPSRRMVGWLVVAVFLVVVPLVSLLVPQRVQDEGCGKRPLLGAALGTESYPTDAIAERCAEIGRAHLRAVGFWFVLPGLVLGSVCVVSLVRARRVRSEDLPVSDAASAQRRESR